MPTREELFQLIESLPEGAIDAAHQSLARLQRWPPPPPPGREEALERFRQHQERMEQRMRERMKPGGIVLGGGAGSFSSGSGGKRHGRYSFGYRDGADSVHETNIVHDAFEFTVIEKFRRDETAGNVLFVIEVTGPDATTARHEHRYPLP